MDAFVEVLKVQVLPVLASVAAAILILLLERLLAYVRVRVAEVNNALARAVLEKLVSAAEQKFGSGGGQDKFRWVAARAADYGLNVTDADIEAVVAMLNGKAVLS